MQSVNESAKQDSAAASAEGTPAPAPAANSGKAKVATAFIVKDKDVVLAAAIARILAAMTGNAAYPSPVPTLATLTAAHDAFVVAVEANDGGVRAVLARDEARENLAEVVWQMAGYVQHACKGNRLTLVTSGFAAQRDRSPGLEQPLSPPAVLKVRQGKASGQAIVRCARVRSARLYQWRYATAQAPTVWILGDTTSRIASTLIGLTPATQYLLQVRVLGKQGASDWSNSAALTTA